MEFIAAALVAALIYQQAGKLRRKEAAKCAEYNARQLAHNQVRMNGWLHSLAGAVQLMAVVTVLSCAALLLAAILGSMAAAVVIALIAGSVYFVFRAS